jgi:hypothetical protein
MTALETLAGWAGSSMTIRQNTENIAVDDEHPLAHLQYFS